MRLAADREIRVQRHDSSLGSWLLGTWAPPALAHVVEAMWYFEGQLVHGRERVFPYGALELIVHLGDDVYREVNASGIEPYSRTCVTGQMLAPLVIEAPACHTAVIGIRLQPTGAYALFGRPMHELTNLTVDLEDLAGATARELEERCGSATGAVARLRMAAAWVCSRLERGSADDAVTWVAERLRESAGTTPIAELLARTGWSTSRFTRVFREQVGITSKALARVYRFNRALDMVSSRTQPLTDIALTCGYYDQSHFNAEFREFCGFPPSEYRARLRYPNSANVPEA